jgi:hypothetical protein
VVLKGDDDIVEQGERPAHLVGVVHTYRQGPRVADGVRIALGIDYDLPRTPYGKLDNAVYHLLGGLVGSLEHDHVAHGQAIHADPFADGDAADRQPRAHAAGQDRGRHPGAPDKGDAGDPHCRKDSQYQDGGDERAKPHGHGCALRVGALGA